MDQRIPLEYSKEILIKFDTDAKFLKYLLECANHRRFFTPFFRGAPKECTAGTQLWTLILESFLGDGI